MLAEWGTGNTLWTLFAFFFWCMAIWVFITVFADIFRRVDLGGGGEGTVDRADLLRAVLRCAGALARSAEVSVGATTRGLRATHQRTCR